MGYLAPAMPVLVTGIHCSATARVRGQLDPGNKCRDDGLVMLTA
jgi:hypothetical protein